MDLADIGLSGLTLGGLGLAGAGGKLLSDVNKTHAALNSFSDLHKDLGPKISNPAINFNDAESILAEYVNRGRRLADSRVLGLPIGKLLQYGRPMMEGNHLGNVLRGGLASVIRRDPKPFMDNVDAFQRAGKHYDMYTNPNTTFGEFRHHHLTDIGIPDEFNSLMNEHGKRDLSVFDDVAMSHINDRSNNFQTMVDKLRAANRHNAADAVSASVLGGQHGPYKAEGFLKKLISGHPGHEAYVSRYRNFGDIASKIFRGGAKGAIGLGLGTAALGAGALGLKNASLKLAFDNDTAAVGAGLSGIGALGAGIGAYKAYNAKPNNNIAFTYGEMPAIGAGHKAPAEALIKTLERAKQLDPRLKNLNIERIVRDRHGVAGMPRQKEYALSINTGFGDSLYPGMSTNPEVGGKSFALPKGTHGANELPVGGDLINARKHIAYQTDLNPFRAMAASHFPQTPTYMELLSSQLRSGKLPNFDVLAYGSDPDAARLVPNFGKVHNLTEGATPAIDPDVAKAIMADSRTSDQVLDDVSKYYETTPQRPSFLADDAARGPLAEQLRSLKGKQLITIAGSGRGDFVGSRAQDLAKAIAAHPELKDKYGIVALLADGFDEQKKLLEGLPNTVGLGRVDRDLYNALQNRAHVNWGSTGASALSEGMLHNAITALPDKWGTGDLSGLVGRHRDLMNGIGRDVLGREVQGPITDEVRKILPKAALDEWNAGGMQYAHQQPGVLKANSAEDIVKALVDKNKLQVLSEGALVRRAKNFELFNKGQKNFVDTVAKLMHEQNAGLRAKFLPRSALGLGLAGLGGLLAYKSQQEPTMMEKLRSYIS